MLELDAVHTMPEKFENATLFLRLGLPGIPHENRAFQKRSSNWRNFRLGKKQFDNEAFQKL